MHTLFTDWPEFGKPSARIVAEVTAIFALGLGDIVFRDFGGLP